MIGNRGAAKRRDERNVRKPDEVGRRPAGKKDTKKWCRGKVGVEHKPVCRDYSEAKLTRFVAHDGHEMKLHKGWKLLVCTGCGKELERYYPWGADKKKPPEWVKQSARVDLNHQSSPPKSDASPG